jgi:hypothetical protein
MNTRYRSLFWPILLIGVGIIWLLGNLNIIQPDSLYNLVQFWPVLLIIAGLDILFGRRWPWFGALLGLLLIAFIIFALVASPVLGLPQAQGWQVQEISEPFNGAQQASLTLDLSSQPAYLHALSGDNLLQGQVSYLRNVDFRSSGGAQRELLLDTDNQGSSTPSFAPFTSASRWDLGLNTQVPWDLTIDGGSGSGQMDLSEVPLSSFSIDQGSGSMRIDLGPGPQAYDAFFNVGSGSLTLTVPNQQSLNVRFDGGSGSINVTLPSGSGIRIDAQDDGSGSFNVPSGLVRQSGEDDTGVWETDGFEQAQYQVLVTVESAGSGSINFNYD